MKAEGGLKENVFMFQRLYGHKDFFFIYIHIPFMLSLPL